MKTFVINLDKNVSRLEAIRARLDQLNIPFERFPAIYGRMLSPAEKRAHSNRFAWWCLRGQKMRDGELGCALSHLGVYKHIVEKKVPIALILEDDAKVYDCLPKVCEYVESNIDLDKSIVVQVANHTGLSFNDWRVVKIESALYSEGYVITNKAAEALLKANSPVCTPSDSWKYWSAKGFIELYQVFPAGCDQEWQSNGYCSDVTPNAGEVENVNDMPLFGKLLWKTKRAIGYVIAKLFF